MTDFQKKLIERIRRLSDEIKEPILEFEELPDKGYLVGAISVYRFWIYDTDEGDFSSDWYDERFEKYDYKTEDELIDNFILKLKEAIQKKDYYREHPSKSPKPLLNRVLDWVMGR